MMIAMRIILAYVPFFAAVFLVASAVYGWRGHHWTSNVFRLDLACFILYSVILRTVVFQSGQQPAPWWYSPSIDLWFIQLSILAVVSACKNEK